MQDCETNSAIFFEDNQMTISDTRIRYHLGPAGRLFFGPAVEAASRIAPETALGKADRQVCSPVTSAAVPLDWPFSPMFQQLILMN